MRRVVCASVLMLGVLGGSTGLWAQQSSPPAAGEQQPRDASKYREPQLAIDGYDPVAYFPEGGGKPAKGKKELSLTHRGVTYRFANAANRDAFKASPDKYEPAYGGWCAYAMADDRRVEIDPKAFKITDGRLYLFYRDLFTDTRDPWNKDEAGLTAKADAAWKKFSGEEPRKGQ